MKHEIYLPDADVKEELQLGVSPRGSRNILLLKTMGWVALTYAAMVLYYFDYMPLWGLILANVLFYTRAYLRMHDLCHAFNTKNGVVRFLPTLFFANPVWGGTTAFNTTHLDHHKYLGTDRDPWVHYYCGHPLRAAFFNLIEPEVNLFNYIKYKGWNRRFAENLAFDVVKQVANIAVFQGAYLVHLLIQRLTHGTIVYLFNFWPHRSHWSANATIGNFNREDQLRPWATFLSLIWSKPVIEAAMYHNRHHVRGQVHEPAHRYVLCSDTGPSTVYIKDWPLPAIRRFTGEKVI
jgi:fatty acid desaturase